MELLAELYLAMNGFTFSRESELLAAPALFLRRLRDRLARLGENTCIRLTVMAEAAGSNPVFPFVGHKKSCRRELG
jgi:hypothetical protein